MDDIIFIFSILILNYLHDRVDKLLQLPIEQQTLDVCSIKQFQEAFWEAEEATLSSL